MDEKSTAKPTEHRSDLAGTADSPDDFTEHRDTARGNSGDRNELSPDQRGTGDGYGPRTHDDTHISRKEGA